MLVKREYVPFKEIIANDPEGAKVFLETFYPRDTEVRRADLLLHFVESNWRLCDREMGWAYGNIGNLISEFERLDKECPYDTLYSMDDFYSAEIINRCSDEQYWTLSLFTKDHDFIGVKQVQRKMFGGASNGDSV